MTICALRVKSTRVGFVQTIIVMCLALVGSHAQAQWGDEWLQESMPSRPRIDTPWDPLSLPIGEVELLASANRLGLSREQIIAFESRLSAYLGQANVARRRSNAIIAGVDLSNWGRLSEPPPADDLNKIANARLGYMRELERLDNGLFDELAPMLSEPQQAMLLSERLRRDRRRILTDGSMLNWGSRQQMQVELRDVLAALDLPEDQREAVLAMATEYEAQATQRLRGIFESVTTFGKDWLAATKPDEHMYQTLQTITPKRMQEIRDLIDMEYQWLDRMAGVLDAENAAELRAAHARAHSSAAQWTGRDHVHAIGQAVAEAEGIDEASREAIAQSIAELVRQRRATLPQLIAVGRRVSVGQSISAFGTYLGITMEDYERLRPLHDRMNTLQREYWQGYSQLRKDMATMLGQEKAAEIQTAVSNAISGGRGQQVNGEYAFSDSNVVTFASMYGGSLRVVLPETAPRCAAAAMASLGMSADDQAIAADILNSFAEQWAGESDSFNTLAGPLMQVFVRPEEVFTVEGHEQGCKAALQALSQMKSAEAAPLESLLAVIDDARVADRVAAAQRWAAIAGAPRNCPAPMDVVRRSHYRTMASLLDQVDPAAALLNLDAPAEALEPVWDVLIEAAPEAIERVWAYRLAVAQAYLLTNRAMKWQQYASQRERESGQQMDWQAYQSLHHAGSEACGAAQQARRGHLEALADLYAKVEALLPPEFASRYAEAISRGAFPDAWSGIDRARRLADYTFALPDLTDMQRQQFQNAWIEHQALLREQVAQLEQSIAGYVAADDMTVTAAGRCAPLYAEIEQVLFERSEAVAAMLRLLRPTLTPAQMQGIEQQFKAGTRAAS